MPTPTGETYRRKLKAQKSHGKILVRALINPPRGYGTIADRSYFGSRGFKNGQAL